MNMAMMMKVMRRWACARWLMQAAAGVNLHYRLEVHRSATSMRQWPAAPPWVKPAAAAVRHGR